MSDQFIVQALKVTDPKGFSSIVDISLRDFFLSDNMKLPQSLQWKCEVVNVYSPSMKEVGKGKTHTEPQTSSYSPQGDDQDLKAQLAAALAEIKALKEKSESSSKKPVVNSKNKKD